MARINPFRWSTKFWDEETGLVDRGERVYRPDWGRWLNQDPIGIEGGLNLYASVGNNSVNHFDALGLRENEDWELDLRLAVASQGSGFVATYAYTTDLLEWQDQIMREGWTR